MVQSLVFVKNVFERMGQLSPAVNELFNREPTVHVPGAGTFETLHVCVGERCVAWFPKSGENVVYYHDQQDGPFYVRWCRNPDRAEIRIRAADSDPRRARDTFERIFDSFLDAVAVEALARGKSIPTDNRDELREVVHALLGRSIAWNVADLSREGGPDATDACIANAARLCVDGTQQGATISAKLLAEAVVATKLYPPEGVNRERTICVPT